MPGAGGAAQQGPQSLPGGGTHVSGSPGQSALRPTEENHVNPALCGNTHTRAPWHGVAGRLRSRSVLEGGKWCARSVKQASRLCDGVCWVFVSSFCQYEL